MAEYKFEQVTVEEKETIGARIANFAERHPSAAVVAYGVACLGVTIPACAAFGCLIGKTAGSTAAKKLLDAGVKLKYE